MDEEFKVKFTIDMGDAKKQVASLKEDLKSTEKMQITPKLGNIGRDMNKVFDNIRKQSNQVEKNLFWSKEKKGEFFNFFKSLENQAYSSLRGMEKKYANLSKQLSLMQQKRSDLREKAQSKNSEAKELKAELEKEMAEKNIRTGTWEDLAKMKKEYDNVTSQIGQYSKGAQEAKKRGDETDYESWLRDIDKLKAYRDQISEKMDNFEVGGLYSPTEQNGKTKGWNDLIQMKKEYDKMTSLLIKARKGAQTAQAEGDTADYESWLRDIEKIKAYRDEIGEKMSSFNPEQAYTPESEDYDKISQLQARLEEVTKEAQEYEKALAKAEENPAFEEKAQELRDIGEAYKQVILDLQGDLTDGDFKSEDFQKLNHEADNLRKNLKRSGQELSANTTLTEKWQKLMARVKSRTMFSIVSLIQPMNIIRNIWSGFLSQNKDVANTFKVISQNLIKVFEPAMRKIADWFFKIMQYVNVFTKSWFNVDLFDKSVLSSEKTKKNLGEMKKLTASFDELNVFNDDTVTVMDTTGLPEVNTAGLQKWANNEGKWIGDALNWALENPLQTLGIALGAKFVAGLLGKGVSSLISKGISKLFGKGKTAAVEEAAKESGAAAGTFWTTKFGTVVKAGTGIALVAAGSALTGFTAHNMTKYWDSMSTGEKVLNGVGNAAGLAAAGLGGYLAAGALVGSAAGPLGAAIGVGIGALVGLTVSAVTARDNILSVKDAQKQYDNALQISAQAKVDYNGAVSDLATTMSNLEAIEQQTGISGAALDEQIKNGTLSVDNMTSAQLQVYSAYLQNQQALENLKTAQENLQIAHENEIKSDMELQLANAQKSKSYDELKEHILDMYQQGEISANEAADYMNRAMGSMSDDARETFMQDVPEAIQTGLDPNKYQSWGRSLVQTVGGWFSSMWKSAQETWQRICNLFKGKGFKTDAQVNADGSANFNVASYDVGTNYVPNDQLAMVHKGEAIIPAKYNNSSYMNGGSDAQMQQTIAAMNGEISALRSLIQQGIPVSGTFIQRGNDLYATVEKAKNKRGNQPISNAAFAR